MASFTWSAVGAGGSPSWGTAVATLAALPATAPVGQIVQALDTNNLYEWNGTTWTLVYNSSGEVIGPASSVDSEVALFNGATGKLLKRASGSGPARLTSGVIGTGSTSLTAEVSGILPVGNGGTNTSAALSNNRNIISSGGALVESAAITASRALASDASGLPVASATTATQLGYLSTTSSDVQTQLNGKQATGNYVTALTGDVTASGPGSVAATVASVGGSTATNVHTAELSANAATNANTVSTIVKRDSSGNFTAGTITAALTGNVTGSASLNVLKGGDTMTGLLTLSADPASANHAATKNYVDTVAQGLTPKGAVLCATTANITLSGEQTIDGIATSASRVLVKNQTTPANNGIYVSAAGGWSRAVDMNLWTEVPSAFVFVERGTINADSGWTCTSDPSGTLDTTAITWTQFAGAGTYTAGSGLSLSGTQFSIPASGVANSMLATGIARSKLAAGAASNILANDGSGNYTELAQVGISQGGTGAATATAGFNALAPSQGGNSGAFLQTNATNTSWISIAAPTSIVAVSTNVTLTNKAIHLVDTSSARTLTLPTPSSGAYLIVKDKTGSAETNNITIAQSASEKIETVAASFACYTKLGSWVFVSDGTDWFIC